MSQVQFTTLVLVLVLLGIPDSHCQEHPVRFEALSSLLNSRNEMVKEMVSLKKNGYHYDKIQRFVEALYNVKQNVRALFSSGDDRRISRQAASNLKDIISSISLPKTLYHSYTLEKDYERIHEFWGKMENQIKSLLDSWSGIYKSFTWSSFCPSDLHLRTLSTSAVCRNSLSCAKKDKLFSTIEKYETKYIKVPKISRSTFMFRKQHGITPFFPGQYSVLTVSAPVYGHEDDLKTVCNEGSTTCNVEKALPLMTAILWYELEYIILRNLCPQSCPDVNNCNYAKSTQFLDEATVLTAYASNLPKFLEQTLNNFHDAFERSGGFSDVEKAMSVVEDASKYFEVTETACTQLQFSNSCPYVDIYNSYRLVKDSIQRNRNPRLVKDLRLYAKIKHSKMIEILKEEMNYINVLSSTKNVDRNLKTFAKGISKYFQGAAEFEKGIADADVAFIKGKLEMYETQVKTVQSELEKKTEKATGLMMAVVSLNLAQKVAEMTALIAMNSNPLKVIFASPDLADIAAKAGEIANAASEIVKGTALLLSLGELTEDSLKLFKGFSENKQQLSSLEGVVNNIKNNNAKDIGKDSKSFLEEYNNYSPKVTRSDIVGNNALWSAFKEAICGLLEGEVGVGGAVPKSVAGGELLCERLEGVMAQYFTLREDIFDFQFQLVDAAARVVQGDIKQRLAKNINGGNDLFYPSELTVAYFLMQGKLQSVASAYCDFLEYKNRGQPVSACETENGVFKRDKLDALIAYKDTTSYTEMTREVFIPTRASFPGDTGYIDLAGLANGENVVLKIPENRTWLQHYHWMLAGQDKVPFLEDLEIFFPPSDNITIGEKLTTQVLTSSIAGSSFFSKNADQKVHYILPRRYNEYRTVYDEGYQFCDDEMQNPYDLCSNLPKICDRSTNIAADILPTVFSTLKVRLLIHQGAKSLKWDAPAPATQFLIRGKAKMRIPAGDGRKRGFKGRLYVRSSSVCCDGNTYIKSPHSRQCEPCPSGSTSRYRGLYCEIEK